MTAAKDLIKLHNILMTASTVSWANVTSCIFHSGGTPAQVNDMYVGGVVAFNVKPHQAALTETKVLFGLVPKVELPQYKQHHMSRISFH